MLFSYGYGQWQNWWWQTNVSPLQVISIAMAVRRCNTKCIAWCSMSRAIPEATGCCHQVTTCSVLPQRLPGQQQTKQQCKNTCTLLALLMVMAMRRYITTFIVRWRRSRASLEATGHHHWASICSNRSNCGHANTAILPCFLAGCCQGWRNFDLIKWNLDRGVTYQTNQKDGEDVMEYLNGGAKLVEQNLNG